LCCLAARPLQAEIDKLKKEGAQFVKGDPQKEAEMLDVHRGRRIHAWVLILAGKRMLEQSLFLEPSTGTAYPLDASPYYAIESLWNASNYWVSLQGEVLPSKMSYDLSASSKWEYLLLDTTMSSLDGEDEEGGFSPEAAAPTTEASKEEGDIEKVFVDMPPSWVTRLDIERECFQSRCPGGHKTIIYNKAQLEKFAPYSREDGLVQRLTAFADAEQSEEGQTEVHEIYANRKDKLCKRVINIVEGSTSEFFEPGRPRGLKKLVEVTNDRREFYFYSSARLDGLVSRIEKFGRKTSQTYEGSRDTLIFRSASYMPAEESTAPRRGDELQIRKMAERYKRSPELDAEQDVAKRTFDVQNGLIKVRYHYGHDRVTHSWRTYGKGTHTVVQVDPFSRYPTDAVMLEEYNRLQAAERECTNQMRESDRQAKEMLAKRVDEESNIKEAMDEAAADMGDGKPTLPAHLCVSVYDTARSKLAIQGEQVEDDGREQVPHDYLTPFLPRPMAKDDPPLSRDEALVARDACLKSLKDRLVERANIVQSRLDEENAALSKRQATFQRNRDHMEAADEAEYERYCQEAMFRIQILEQRLDRHTELSLHKYAEMDARLRNDARLSTLNAGAN